MWKKPSLKVFYKLWAIPSPFISTSLTNSSFPTAPKRMRIYSNATPTARMCIWNLCSRTNISGGTTSNFHSMEKVFISGGHLFSLSSLSSFLPAPRLVAFSSFHISTLYLWFNLATLRATCLRVSCSLSVQLFRRCIWNHPGVWNSPLPGPQTGNFVALKYAPQPRNHYAILVSLKRLLTWQGDRDRFSTISF